MNMHKFWGIAAFICMIMAMLSGISMVKGRSEKSED